MTTAADAARVAFGYGVATVDLYRVLHNFALDPDNPEFRAPLNQLSHSRRLADPTDRSIVAMNVDTPYSYAWLDLRAEPMVLTMPATSPDRYQSAQLLDLYTYIVGYVSPRTDGVDGGEFLIAGPDWRGRAPSGMKVFECPTQLCLVFIRTQLFGDDDLPEVIALQDAISVQPLSGWRRQSPPAAPPTLQPIPVVDVRARLQTDFLRVLDWMLRLMPTLPEDLGTRRTLARIGVGADLDRALHDPALVGGIEEGLAAGMQDLVARMGTVGSSAELFGSREFFAGDHLSRAAGAFLGILGNAAEEYLGVGYPADADGHPFHGSSRYTITFPRDDLPPVGAFWSITVYDDQQFLYPNELDRYVLGSRQLDTMRRNTDGSLTINVQHDAPSTERLGNWLPCPAGDFTLTFRTYLPLMEIRQGIWTAPPAVPTEEKR